MNDDSMEEIINRLVQISDRLTNAAQTLRGLITRLPKPPEGDDDGCSNTVA